MIRSLFILLILFTNCKSNKSTNQIFSKDVMKEILKSVQIIEAKYQHQKVIDSEPRDSKQGTMGALGIPTRKPQEPCLTLGLGL